VVQTERMGRDERMVEGKGERASDGAPSFPQYKVEEVAPRFTA